MNAKRIAIVGNQAFAMRNFRQPLITELISKGFEIFALAPDYTEDDRVSIKRLGAIPVDYPLKRASISPLYDLLTLSRLTTLLRQIAPEVVLSYSAKPVVFGTLAGASARVPSRYALVEGLGHAFMPGGGAKASLLRLVVTRLYRFALARATRTFFLNDDDREDFVRGRMVSNTRSLTVGAIGVDLSKWLPAPHIVDPMTFLFVGRLLREKGIIEFVEAARRVKSQHPGSRFVVLGAPDSNPSSVTADQAQSWVNEGILEWPGQTDVRPWLTQASVFVLPSYREGVPMSTQEALATARPVITTDVPGCRETVENLRNGILVKPMDVAGLAEAMLTFISNPSLVSSMGKESRAIAEKRFDTRKTTARFVSAMQL